jgi:hypothetical protein
MLLVVVLASFLCMGFRSLLTLDLIGILVWPVLLGFGAERCAGGHGVCGGTIASLLAFGTAGMVLLSGSQGFALTSFGPWLNPFVLLMLAAGGCWGFYLSVWVYILFETILQWL